jgi:hypothetical protein
MEAGTLLRERKRPRRKLAPLGASRQMEINEAQWFPARQGAYKIGCLICTLAAIGPNRAGKGHTIELVRSNRTTCTLFDPAENLHRPAVQIRGVKGQAGSQ